MIIKSQNVKSEIKIPDDLIDFRGYDNQVDKTAKGKSITFRFGSPVDQSAAKLFKRLKNFESWEGRRELSGQIFVEEGSSWEELKNEAMQPDFDQSEYNEKQKGILKILIEAQKSKGVAA